MRCPAWWDVESANTYPDFEDVDSILESAEFVRSLVRAEIEKGTPPSRIILAGFSQGAALALYAACTVLEDKLLAVLCFAGESLRLMQFPLMQFPCFLLTCHFVPNPSTASGGILSCITGFVLLECMWSTLCTP